MQPCWEHREMRVLVLLGLQTLFSVLIATPSPHRERHFRDCDVYQLPHFPFHFTGVILTPWALGALTIWTLCSATGGEWNRSLLHRSDEAAERWVPSSTLRWLLL